MVQRPLQPLAQSMRDLLYTVGIYRRCDHRDDGAWLAVEVRGFRFDMWPGMRRFDVFVCGWIASQN